MNLQHINLKIYLDGDLNVDGNRLIEVFHEWVREQSFEGLLLIDVADYRHVPQGPKLLAVGLEADFILDHSDNRYAIRYNRKKPLAGSSQEQFADALKMASKACGLLEKKFPGELTFLLNGFDILVNDRALAPNNAETFEGCKEEIEAFVGTLGGGDVSRIHQEDERKLFGVSVALSKPLTLG